MALTVDDVYEYVGIEAAWADEAQRRRAERALNAAKMWIVGAVGKRRDLDDPLGWLAWPLAEETMLMAAGEMYENRSLVDANLSKYAGSKAVASLNRLAFDSLLQLKYAAPWPSTEPEGGEEDDAEPPDEGEEGPGASDGPDQAQGELQGGGEPPCPSETP